MVLFGCCLIALTIWLVGSALVDVVEQGFERLIKTQTDNKE